MLSKRSFWTERLTEMGQPSKVVDGAVLKGLPALVVGSGAVALWQWNAALGLSVLVGVSSTVALLQTSQRFQSTQLRQWLNHAYRPLFFSLGGGAVLLALTYATVSVWQEFHSPWLALLLLTQALGILVLAGLVLWLVTQQGDAPVYSFDRCVAGLLHRDELQRLVAVRKIAALAVQQRLSSGEQKIVAEYLQILLRRQDNPVLQGAIHESLVALKIPTQLSAHSVTLGALQPLASQPQSQPIGVKESLHSYT
jgi:hypothetical protein